MILSERRLDMTLKYPVPECAEVQENRLHGRQDSHLRQHKPSRRVGPEEKPRAEHDRLGDEAQGGGFKCFVEKMSKLWFGGKWSIWSTKLFATKDHLQVPAQRRITRLHRFQRLTTAGCLSLRRLEFNDGLGEKEMSCSSAVLQSCNVESIKVASFSFGSG